MLRFFAQFLALVAISAMADVTLLSPSGEVSLVQPVDKPFNHAEMMQQRRSLQSGSRTCGSIVVPPCARGGNRDSKFSLRLRPLKPITN